jgi:hypothetical protein
MQRIRSNRTKLATLLSWKQWIVAWLLFGLLSLLVIDPLWECHDHLDDLRHFGPHGLLLVLLIVACAGISLLKSFQWLGLLLLSIIAGRLRPMIVLAGLSHGAPVAAFAAAPPPLRV